MQECDDVFYINEEEIIHKLKQYSAKIEIKNLSQTKDTRYMDYLFTLLILMVAVTTVVILAKRIASHTFKCKNCSEEFNISWTKVIVTEHSDNEYMLVCPCCKTKGWCTEQLTK